MAKKKKLTPEEKQAIQVKTSFQQRLPIEDIKNRLFFTKDNRYLPVFSLGQKAVDLMSDDDIVSFANQIEVAFEAMGVEKTQFLLLPIPFDLKPYTKNLRERMNNLKNNSGQYNPEQLILLEDYINRQQDWASTCLRTGKIANKKCYLIFDIKDSWNEKAVQEASFTIEANLKSLANDSYRCSEEEMEKILVEMFNPLRPEIYTNS